MGIFKKIKDGINNMKRKYTKNPLQKRVSDFNKIMKQIGRYDDTHAANYVERLQREITGRGATLTGTGKLSVSNLSDDLLKLLEEIVPSSESWIKYQENFDKNLSRQAALEAEMTAAEQNFKVWYEHEGANAVIAEDPEFREMLSLVGSNWHYGRAPAYDLNYAAEMIAAGIQDMEDF